jgi:ubiquinone/menaquinone biosynthesis C-methylase UbiE/uncharacterized protein YbaR (Trm112 family)
LVPNLLGNWRGFTLGGPERALEHVGWMLVATVIGVLPFTFHRLLNPRLRGVLSTLPLPLATVAIQTLALEWLPAGVSSIGHLAQTQKADTPLLQLGATFGSAAIVFLVYWFAAVILWMWNHEFRAATTRSGATFVAACYALAAAYGLFRQFSGAVLPPSLPTGAIFAWICLGGALGLGAWALVAFRQPGRRWADKPESVARLRSPLTGDPLHVVGEEDREALLSSSGERFPIHNGVPVFLKPEDLTGPNLKYNHMYETIGGFYDDTQRVACALGGMDRAEYVMSYLGRLEVKPGDSVLETSVGTGLNFKYLPRGAKLSGLDLSSEMLVNCQANLRRWELDADLYLGNAESLPFADSSFDVVFHTGGINFFSDRSKAIREMIRVAKPGSLLLIGDETEEYVKSNYERTLGRYYKGRKEKVTVPTGLLPPEMQEIRVDILLKGRFYALSFRKPAIAS